VSRVMKPAGYEKSQGIISSAYAKDPTDPQWKNDKEYLEWVAFMKKWYPRGNLNSSFNAYAYAVAKTMEHVLKQAGDNLTRENIMRTAASMKDVRVPMLLPGVMLNTGPGDFRPIEQMQLMRFEGETFKRFGPIIDAGGSS